MEDVLFPIAFGIVMVKNDMNWTWFLIKLKSAILTYNDPNQQFTFLSDCQKGIIKGVKHVFPTAKYAFCMHHLAENFRRQFKNLTMVGYLWRAAYTLTIEEYENEIQHIA